MRQVQLRSIAVGANSFTVDFASSFGGALVLTNASFTVRINPGDNDLGGVQLWENGPSPKIAPPRGSPPTACPGDWWDAD